MGVLHSCVWDEYSDYLLETRVLTSSDFNFCFDSEIFSIEELIFSNPFFYENSLNSELLYIQTE